MGLFSDDTLEESQIRNLNSILPERYQKPSWKINDFKGDNGIYNRISSLIDGKKATYIKLKKKINKLQDSTQEVVISNIKIYNTELYEAEPLGMVDVGIVERFAATSSGDRFAVGAIGYAIEQAIDEAYTKTNMQEDSVNKAKYALLKKARGIYPECNMIFKYEVDFRELGSSGNVFIYMRGTAAKGKSDLIEKAIKKVNKEISELNKELENLEKEGQQLFEIRAKIPQNKNEIAQLL